MRSSALPLLKAVMWFIAAFHLVMGGGLMVSHPFQRMAVGVYGASVTWTPQIIYLARIIGSFAFVLGVMALAAAIDPLRHKIVVYGFVTLFVVRDVHRLVFAREIEAAFGLPAHMNLVTNLFFISQAVAVFVLLQVARIESVKRPIASGS